MYKVEWKRKAKQCVVCNTREGDIRTLDYKFTEYGANNGFDLCEKCFKEYQKQIKDIKV